MSYMAENGLCVRSTSLSGPEPGTKQLIQSLHLQYITQFLQRDHIFKWHFYYKTFCDI
jgi:hypothetical protein